VRESAGGEPATTDNRMELQAAISALKSLKEKREVTLFAANAAGIPGRGFATV